MTRKRLSRALATVLILCMMIPMVTPIWAAEGAVAPRPAPAHWASEELDDWVEKGWLKGDENGNLNPDANVSRAQFMAFVNRMMGFSGDSAAIDEYSDVPKDAWYCGDVAAALAAGYMQGADGRMRPEEYITRNEAVTILARIAGLETATVKEEALAGVSDGAEVPAWARAALSSAVTAGLIGGIDGAFCGTRNISRAETVVMLGRVENGNRVFGFAGTYSGGEANHVTLAAGGIVLKDMKIAGDLTVSSAVGEGEVTIEDVTVAGALLVRGGGPNSVYLIRVSVAGDVSVEKEDVRIVLVGECDIDTILLLAAAIIDAAQATGGKISIEIIEVPDGETVTLIGGFGTVTNGASGVALNLTGSVGTLVLGAPATVTGTGTVDKAEVSAEAGAGTSFEIAPKELTGAGKDAVTLPAAPAAPAGGGGGGPGGNTGTPEATAVILAPGSLGVAGDKKITGLTSGKYYKIEVGTGASKRVKYESYFGLKDSFYEITPVDFTEIIGLTNGETYKVIEAAPFALTDVLVYEYTSESAANDITSRAAVSGSTLTIYEDDIRRDPVPIFAVYANLDAILGTPSRTNPLRMVTHYSPVAERVTYVLRTCAVKLDEVHAATPPYDTNRWIPYADMDAFLGGVSVTRAELNLPFYYSLIFNYGTNTAIINPALSGLTELNIPVAAQERVYVFDNGTQFGYFTVELTPNELSQAKREKLEELRIVQSDEGSQLPNCTPESVQAYHEAIEFDHAAIAAMTTIPDVEAYVLTTIAARAALELKTAADDRLVTAKKNDTTFLNATYATRAAAETAIRALAVYGTLNDASISWTGITATIALNTGTAVFAFTDITSSGFVQVSFTAEQVGGAVGTADSTGIKITFDQPVTGLTAGKISVVSLSGAATKGALTGSGTTWTIAISVAAAGSVVVTVGDFRDFTVVPVPQVVTLYKVAGTAPQALVLPFTATDAAQSAVRITLNNAADSFHWDASEGLSAVTHGAQTMTTVGRALWMNSEMTGYDRLTLFLGEKMTSLTENDYTVTLSADAFVGGIVPNPADVTILPLIALTPPEIALTPNTVSGGLTVTITDTVNPIDAVWFYSLTVSPEGDPDVFESCLIRRGQDGTVTIGQIPLADGIQAGQSYYVSRVSMIPVLDKSDVYASISSRVVCSPAVAAPAADPGENYAFVLDIAWAGGLFGYAQAKLLFPNGRTEIVKSSAFYDNSATPVKHIPDATNWTATGAAACVYRQFVNYTYSSSDGTYTLYQLPADELIPAADLQATADAQVYTLGDAQFGTTPVDDRTLFLYETWDGGGLEYKSYLGGAPSAQLRGGAPVVGGVKNAQGVATLLFAQVEVLDRGGDYVYFESVSYSQDSEYTYHFSSAYFNGYKTEIKMNPALGALVVAGGRGGLYRVKSVDIDGVVTALESAGDVPINYLGTREDIIAVGEGTVTLGTTGNCTFGPDTRVFLVDGNGELKKVTSAMIQPTDAANPDGTYRAYVSSIIYGGGIREIYLVYQPYVPSEP